MPATRYELGKCTVTVDDYVISGWGVQGGVEIVFPETASVESGVDGENAVSFQTLHTATVKITLMATARANHHLSEIWKAQLAEDTLTKRTFTLRDPSSGDEVNAKACVVTKTADMVKNAKAGERVWELAIFDFTRDFAPNV